MMDSTNQEDLIFEKNSQFYHERYQRSLRWLLLMSAAAIGLSFLLGLVVVVREQPDYYATTTTGEIIPLNSLSQPVVTNSYLMQWASLATRAAYNLDFVHYADQLNQAKVYFTDQGWDQFNKALNDSGLLKDVQDKKLVMSAIVASTPVLLNSGEFNGRFMWRVQLPILVTFTSASETTKRTLVVTMNIQRVPVLTAPKGILITDFSAAFSDFTNNPVNQPGQP